jgi:chromate reductase, NAD(P)H dehydrogenase (quinone)
MFSNPDDYLGIIYLVMKINPKVLVFAGSTRTGSLHGKLAALAAGELRGAGVDVTLANLRDYPMPLYDGDLEAASGVPESAHRFKELVRGHDALVIASPEYNGSFSALVKNTIDWISRPAPGEPMLAVFRGKQAALLSASPGPGAGKRGLRHLRELLEMIGMKVVSTQVAVPRAAEAFDESGNLIRPEDRAALRQLVEELAMAAGEQAVAAGGALPG